MECFFEDETAQMDVVPLILVKNDEYIVVESTLTWLESHARAFAVVACAGKYRTGKSFLLNRLARAASGTGFGVGETVQACTKGLWVYKRFFATDDPDKDMLFIDTEGIDALDADDTHDVRIFTLALLLSSVFIYNSIGAIDETAMQTLSLMTKVTNNVRIQADSECSTADLSEHMPDFFWVLRDFALRMTDREGGAISAAQYLEQSLQTTDPQRDHIRASIRDAFKVRNLVPLPRPDTNANSLEDRLYNISSKFTGAVDEFRSRLAREARPMTSQNKIVTGRMYGTLCRHFVDVVQTNAVPVIRDSWTLMAAVQARDLKDELTCDFEKEAEGLEKQPGHVIDVLLRDLQEKTLFSYDSRAMAPVDQEIRESLKERLLVLAGNARVLLARNLGEDVARLLDQVEAVALSEMDASVNIAEAIAAKEEEFLSDFGNDDAVKRTWLTGLTDRVIKWLSRVAKRAAVQREECELRLSTERERCASLQREMADVRESNAQEFVIRVRQLEQELESRVDEIASLNRCMTQQTDTLMAHEQKCRILEIEIAQLRTKDNDEESADPPPLRDSDADDQLQLDLAHAQNALLTEQHLHEASQKRASELEDKLKHLTATYARLESSWKNGLEELRLNEHKIRSDAEQRIKQHDESQKRVQFQLDESRVTISGMEERIRALAASAESNAEVCQNEKVQLREAAQRHRDQCEAAQQRVIEIHRNMLTDLRERDERSREQQAVYLRERAELQMRVSELAHESEKTKEALSLSKRRYSEYDNMERETKRLKSQHQADAIVVSRLETEVEQMKRMTNTMGDDRERLRQENLHMEGELAVLRAEKQLNDARNSLK